ncbi:hypothetical protein BROUX41_001582 [Berkeleyomyces rouxiae]|uniref:uncharacterized protein n=1 Tax=Berkeleyomyces rouxiae TaxID=2035830 RepID=UPI003B75FF59
MDPPPPEALAVRDLQNPSPWLFAEPDADRRTTLYFGRDISDVSDGRLPPGDALPCTSFFTLPQIDGDAAVEVLSLPCLDLVAPTAHGAAAGDASNGPESAEADSDSGSCAGDDLWLAASTPAPKQPSYHSWAAFVSPDDGPPAPEALLMTEAPPEAYDAILPQISPQESPDTVADTSIYMACLLSAVLGRESVFFSWNADKTALAPAIPNLRVSGHSRHVLRRLESRCLTCGTLFGLLQAFVHSTYTTASSRCRVALGSAIETVLGVVESDMALVAQPQSLLQLLVLIDKVHLVFTQFHELVARLRPDHPDEAILQAVFQHAQISEYSSAPIHAAMRVLLQRVSQPWIDFIEEWVGLKHEDGLPLRKDDVGAAKHFVKVEPEIFIDDFGEEVEEVDFRLDRSRMPDFVPNDMADSIFEAGRNIRFIRTEHAGHPLTNLDTVASNSPPDSAWRFDWDSILDLEKRAVAYETALVQAIAAARQSSAVDATPPAEKFDPPLAGLPSTTDSTAGWGLQIYGFDEPDIGAHLDVSMVELAKPLPELVRRDPLADTIRECLQHQRQDPSTQNLPITATPALRHPGSSVQVVAPHWSLLPLLSFNPLTSAHGKVVNRESLKLLFTHHDLLGHLRLQKDFHLFGNGRFASRLTHALFDPQLETTERVAGVAAQGGLMGLRLTSRDKWPPASSELRLALMGILAESYAAGASAAPQATASAARNTADLPGDLSFAVRTMTDADIDKCMDPNALEAMDFLRLSYKPPPALAPIFTPLIMMQYDRIFKQMLRVARLLYVVDGLSRSAIAPSATAAGAGASTIARRFCYEAHHFVYTVAGHFVDCGITLPWRAFEAWLAGVQRDLVADSAPAPEAGASPTRRASRTHSPERLRVCHALILDRVLISLFLRKRQQHVSALLNDIFGLVLRFDKVFRRTHSAARSRTRVRPDAGQEARAEDAAVAALYADFRAKVASFIAVCRAITEKPDITVRYEARDKADEVRAELGDALDGNTVAMLLVKLDIAGFYLKGHDV